MAKTKTPKIWEPEECYVLELKQMQAYVERLNKSIAEMVSPTEKEMANIEFQTEDLVRKQHQKLFK